MSNSSALVIDNLILQQVGETLQVGLADDDRVELAASGEKGYEVRAITTPNLQYFPLKLPLYCDDDPAILT